MARFRKPRLHLPAVLLLLSVVECAYGQEGYLMGLEVDADCLPMDVSAPQLPASPHDFVAASPRLHAANFSLVYWQVGVPFPNKFPKTPNAFEDPPQRSLPTIAILAPAVKPHEERFHWVARVGRILSLSRD